MILLWIISPLCFVFVHCSLVVTCLEMAYLLDFLYMLFYCAFVTFPCGVLGQVWCLIVSVPDLCLLSNFHIYIHLFQQTLQMFFFFCHRTVKVFRGCTDTIYTGNTKDDWGNIKQYILVQPKNIDPTLQCFQR